MDLTTEQRTARDTIISPIVDELFKIKVKSPNHKLARNVISNKLKYMKVRHSLDYISYHT